MAPVHEDGDLLDSEPIYWSEEIAFRRALKDLESLPTARSLQVLELWLSTALSDAEQEAPPGLYHAAWCCLRALLSQPQTEHDARIALGAAELSLGALIDRESIEPDSLRRQLRVLVRIVDFVDATPWSAPVRTAGGDAEPPVPSAVQPPGRRGAVPFASRQDRDARTVARLLQRYLGAGERPPINHEQMKVALGEPPSGATNPSEARLHAIATAARIHVTRDALHKALRGWWSPRSP